MPVFFMVFDKNGFSDFWVYILFLTGFYMKY